MHAPLLVSLVLGLAVGFLAQRSRFCTMGALRDVLAFPPDTPAHRGALALVVFAFLPPIWWWASSIPDLPKQPVAHTMQLWNFLGMALAGLAFALAGGCPGRQLFLAGRGRRRRGGPLCGA